MDNLIPPKLMEIISDFELSEGREKIELLLQYSEQMPGLPARIQEQHDSMDFVQECMTPVYVIAERDASGMHFFFDVPGRIPHRARLRRHHGSRAGWRRPGAGVKSAQ